jgi:hypothetical protein
MDLQRQLSSSIQCDNIREPIEADYDKLDPGSFAADGFKLASIYNEMLVSAFACGLTKIAVLAVGGEAPEFSGGDLHQELWHKWAHEPTHDDLKKAVKWSFRSVVADLISRLDAVTDSDGKTLLDNTIVVLMGENSVPHENYAWPIVTFGSGGGRFATGKYLDFRDPLFALGVWSGHAAFSGIPVQLFFNSILQGFGITPAEYELPRRGIYQYGGYGAIYPGGDWGDEHSTVRKDAGGVNFMRKHKSTIFKHWQSSGILSRADDTLPGFLLI